MLACRRLLVLATLALACGRHDLESPDPSTRARAVRALGEARGDSILTALLVAARDASPLVRAAAAEAFAARGGPGDADALGKLLVDPAPVVSEAAARGLASMPGEARARQHLVGGYGEACPSGRAAIADALERIGVSLREAVEAEAQGLWRRNLAALEHGTGATRAGAAEELGASGRAEAVQRLVPLVDPNRNPDRLLAAAAARGLGESGDWTSRPHLEALLDEGDPLLGAAAAAALARLGDPAAADSLADAALRDSDPRVAVAAVEALAALPEAPEVGIALCEVVLRSEGRAVAGRAATAVRVRDAECPERAVLARLARPGTLAAVDAVGELALSRSGADAAALRIAPLLEASRAPDPMVRREAARALGRLGGPAAAAAVGRKLASVTAAVTDRRARAPSHEADGSNEQADELAGLLAAAGRLKVAGAEALLLGWARDAVPAVRAGAVEGLGSLATDAALDTLASALEDPDPAVRLAALEALASAGVRGAPALVRATARWRSAQGADGDFAAALARALGRTMAAEAVPALATLLEGGAPAAAAEALARIGAPAAVGPLVAHLGRAGAPGRAEAVEALAQLVSLESAHAIAALLTDDRAEIRATAARALGRLRYEPAAGRIEALRSDYHGRVRRAAVEAIAKLPAGSGPRARR